MQKFPGREGLTGIAMAVSLIYIYMYNIPHFAVLSYFAQKQIFTDKIFVVETCINHTQPIVSACTVLIEMVYAMN